MNEGDAPTASHDSATGPTIFLHIGTPKSGTTYLQSRMAANHKQAKAQGLLWPGPGWGTHVSAVRELRTLKPGEELQPDGPWLTLVREARAWSGPRVLISMEWLAGLAPEQVAYAVNSFGRDRVEVICTARDLLRSFVAQWQEMTKNRRPWSWGQFVEEMVEEKEGPAEHRFWNQQDIPRILTKWAEQVGWERIHLVTVPPKEADPGLLWQRFCSVIELDGTTFEPPERANESLGVVSAALMHRVNLAAIAQRVSYEEYQRVLHRQLAQRILAPRRGSEATITVTPQVEEWIRGRADRLVDELREQDLDIVGDLADLLPGKALEGREPDAVSDSEMLDVCVDALVSLAVVQYQNNARLRDQVKQLRHQLKPARGQEPEMGNPAHHGVRRRVERLTARGRSTITQVKRRLARPR